MFTRSLNATVFVRSIFDLFDVKCKQDHKSVCIEPILNSTKNGDVDGTYKPCLKMPFSGLLS